MSDPIRRRGLAGPTLLVALCALLGLTVACLWGLPWLWLWSAILVALAALLVAAYVDGQRDAARLDALDADEAIRLAVDPGPLPGSAAVLGARLADAELRRALRRWNQDQP